MKGFCLFGLCLGVSLVSVAHANPLASPRVVKAYRNLPLTFEANQGQSVPKVKFLSRGDGYNLFLTSNEAVLALQERSGPQSVLTSARRWNLPGEISSDGKPAVFRMKLIGANAQAEVTGQNQLPGKSNYFIGKDPRNWRRDIRLFAKVRYQNVYPGVDLVYY